MHPPGMLQLSPPIPVRTPLGDGWALLVIDYGPQWNTCWAVQLHQSGELKHFDSNDIRFPKNHTYDTPRGRVQRGSAVFPGQGARSESLDEPAPESRSPLNDRSPGRGAPV